MRSRDQPEASNPCLGLSSIGKPSSLILKAVFQLSVRFRKSSERSNRENRAKYWRIVAGWPFSEGLLVDRVELKEHGIKVSLELPAAHGGAHLKLTRLIPMQLRRRGIEMKFLIGGDSLVSRRSDPALVKLIGRARCWFEDLLSGRAHSMVDIGKREKVGKRYVSRVIRFAFLAPNIVEQIAGDHQPPDFTAESLLRGQAELPLAWDAQRKLLGFSPPTLVVLGTLGREHFFVSHRSSPLSPRFGQILFESAHTVGLMFWFMRKKLVGSYLFLIATRRSQFWPNAARAWSGTPMLLT